MASIDGLISGLSTEKIIDGLIALQQGKVDRLNLQKAEIQAKQRALQGVEGRLLTLRSQMSALNRNLNSVFTARQVQSSQESIVTASANQRAIEGTYTLRVTSRAQAHQIASAGFNNSSQTITAGSISFQVGNRPATTITIDSSNNTVSGLVQAINAQSTDISATMIRDQATQTDRILLTSKHTGAANQIVIVNQLADSHDDAIRPDFSGPDVQQATNAAVVLGSGPGAITVESVSNQIDGLIEGVTLNITSVDANQDVVITVSRDTSKAQQAIQDFVSEFNSLMEYLDEQTKYNTATQTASPLTGQRSVSVLKNQLLTMVTGTVPGLDSNLNRFSQVGITINANGRLSVNSDRLTSALNGQLDGIAAGGVARLFGMTASISNPGIEFVLGSSKTKASTGPYQVDIVQAAEQAVMAATNALNDLIVIDNTNRQFEIQVDGIRSETLTLAEGTYTPGELAEHLQSIINSSAVLGNREVAVSITDNRIQITSLSYGSNSKISSFIGTAATLLGFVGSETAVGKDVAGSFIANGVVEPATGSGRLLIGNINNPNTADLQVRVLLDSSQIHDGIEAELSLSRGITSRIDQYLSDFLDSEKGTLTTAKASFDSQNESINQSIERVNQVTSAKREYLLKQFAALERALSALQTTSSVVSSQLAGLQRLR